jgi:RNA 2',3'-cyclic 3'-phosphodiesterase
MNRLFLAILPTPLVHAKLLEYVPKVQEKLDRQGMRWVRPEKWHITIGFVGDAEIDDVINFLKTMDLSSIHELSITLGGISGFPDLKRPGVLFQTVDPPHSNFMKLRETVGDVLQESEDEFVPRLMLARMKPASTKLGHKLRDYIHSGAKLEDVSWVAEEVVLFNSLPNGEYEKIYTFPLTRSK